MRVTVVTPTELGGSEAALWRKFQRSSPLASHPCLSLTYVRAYSHRDANTRIAIAEDGADVAAFLPYRLDENRIAVPAAGGSMLEGLVYPVGEPIDVRLLIKQAGLRGYRFYHTPAEQTAFRPYCYQYNSLGTTTYVANLSAGYDEYLRGLSESVKKRISRTATYRRSLERKVGPVVFEWNSFTPKYLGQLIEWKSKQFDAIGRHFSMPGALSVIEELATSTHSDCSGVMSVLLAGGEAIAIVFSLRADDLLTPNILAYDPQFSRFSPGTIEWLALLSEAPRHGVTRVDFGPGLETYKRWLGNTSYQKSGGGVWASRVEAAARSTYRRVRYRPAPQGSDEQPASHESASVRA